MDLYPDELAATVCGRISVRTNDDCRYFTDKYQFMPKKGYTKMFEKMLTHKNIEILLNTDYKTILNEVQLNKMIYTGPIDYFFDYLFGKLPYRPIRFEFEKCDKSFYQSVAQVHCVDNYDQFTRIVEHKYLSGQSSNCTIISKEYPQFSGEPFYPIPNEKNKNIFENYKIEAEKLNNLFFCGRLAEYQYYNMDHVVTNTFKLLNTISNG